MLLLSNSFSPSSMQSTAHFWVAFTTFSLLIWSLLHSTFSLPALPSSNNKINNNEQRNFIPYGGSTTSQPFPIQQQKSVSGVASPPFLTSFSGYSYDYTHTAPNIYKKQMRRNNGLDFEASPMMSTISYDSIVEIGQQPLRGQATNRNEDAFLIRSDPSEQFISPPVHLLPPKTETDPKEEMAKFLPPPNSQKPKLTGWVTGLHESSVRPGEPFPGGHAIANPAAYYMQGVDLTKIPQPRCKLIGCQGPVPNDADFQLEQQELAPADKIDQTCHHVFVPLNSCLDGRGYSVGMICSIWCECSIQLVREMHKSRGWIQGYRPQPTP